MEKLGITLLIGIAAAVIDVVPMVIQKLEKRACISAGIHWIVLGLIIPYVEWRTPPALKGALIGMLTAIPVMVIVSATDKKALIPMTIFSLLLGVGVGVAGAAYIR